MNALRPQRRHQAVALSEVLDRVLNKGAVVTGEIVISVAGIELAYVGLNVVLTSIQTARDCALETVAGAPRDTD